jgi:hypothetical protein
MEPGHCREIRGQGFALARFKLLEQVVHGLLDELLCGVVFLRGALLVGRFARLRSAAFLLCGAVVVLCCCWCKA